MTRAYHRWTNDERIKLRSMWNSGHTKPEIAAALERHTPQSITTQAKKLGLSTRRKRYERWTRGELEALAMMWPNASQAEIQKAIKNHPWDVIQHKAQLIGVRRFWNPHRAKQASRIPIIAALRHRRLELRMHATDLGKRMGYDPINIRRWELAGSKSGMKPRLDALLDWCEALGVELALVPKPVLE